MNAIPFAPPPGEAPYRTLRAEVREFLGEALPAGYSAFDRARSWNGHDPEFSRRLGARGWLGMTLPKAYAGHERSPLERYVVVEELLAAGAPVAAHWIADRQSAPLILHFGTEAQRRAVLPGIAAGETYFCIGMSEPGSGSDLAAARTSAQPVDGGYRINGTKLWTTYAHKAHYMILFCRTGAAEDRHGGTSQLLIDLKTPGVRISPIIDLAGEHHFNEVAFEDVFVPAGALIGVEGDGWRQVMSELAFERSGPDRFLSAFALMIELMRVLEAAPDRQAKRAVGRLAAHLMVLRHMSRSIAGMLARGENPALQATIVKDLGTLLEQEIPEIARSLVPAGIGDQEDEAFVATFARVLTAAPSFSLRGGTREILRGIIARGLGLR
ncbi:MAG: acyl-CoA dehydrogenase family protein [Rhizobiales bacterium]|nr:acyl-CoA dehydrogenase family protein [Hyphomicrobiales bacterium]OJU35743.1 MAG: acyl-CoA dehydrogenase [Rhizobiales bacterium 68-8]